MGHSKITILGSPSMGNYLLIICAGIVQCELSDNVLQLCKLSVLFYHLLQEHHSLIVLSKVD